MKAYCLKCRKDTAYINPNVLGNSNAKATILSKCAIMILSKCAICGSKKSRSIKNQEAKGLLSLSNLGHRTPLSKVPVLSDILF